MCECTPTPRLTFDTAPGESLPAYGDLFAWLHEGEYALITAEMRGVFAFGRRAVLHAR